MSKTYRPYQPRQSFLLPPSPQDWLPEGHLCYFLMDVVEQLDLGAIYAAYQKEERGYPPHHPQMMVALLLYAYCIGVPSSRKIEKRTQEDIAFRVSIGRVYMTGVSPVTLDDLSSGFNIPDLLSMRPELNALCGFTQAEVEVLVSEVLRQVPQIGDWDQVLRDMARYYNGYLFSTGATERLYNPDMVLYFLKKARSARGYPQELLDVNVRTDYGKLRQPAARCGQRGAGAARAAGNDPDGGRAFRAAGGALRRATDVPAAAPGLAALLHGTAHHRRHRAWYAPSGGAQSGDPHPALGAAGPDARPASRGGGGHDGPAAGRIHDGLRGQSGPLAGPDPRPGAAGAEQWRSHPIR